MKTWKAMLVLLLIPAILLALSACGKENRPTVPSDTTKAPEESSTPADGSDPTQPIVLDIDLTQPWRSQTKMNLNPVQSEWLPKQKIHFV